MSKFYDADLSLQAARLLGLSKVGLTVAEARKLDNFNKDIQLIERLLKKANIQYNSFVGLNCFLAWCPKKHRIVYADDTIFTGSRSTEDKTPLAEMPADVRQFVMQEKTVPELLKAINDHLEEESENDED